MIAEVIATLGNKYVFFIMQFSVDGILIKNNSKRSSFRSSLNEKQHKIGKM